VVVIHTFFSPFYAGCLPFRSDLTITASVFANIWKFKCQPGDLITSETQVLVILEAMKTEIPITAGESNVGKTVKSFVTGREEGTSVRPGDALLVLE